MAEQVRVGALFVPFQDPLKPKVVEAFAPNLPLWLTFVAVTDDPLEVIDAFHESVMVWPLGSHAVPVGDPTPHLGDGGAPSATSPGRWPPGHERARDGVGTRRSFE